MASPEAHERHLGDLKALMQDLELAIVLAGTDAGCALSQLMIMAFVRASRQPFQVHTPPPAMHAVSKHHCRSLPVCLPSI